MTKVGALRSYTYLKVHKELYKKRGSARNYTCQCGEPAVDWAYQFTGEELRDANGACPHSVNIEDYAAMCRKCHIEFDLEHDPAAAEKIEEGRTRGQKKAGKSTMSVRVKCRTCGMVTTHLAMGTHIKATGHMKEIGAL